MAAGFMIAMVLAAGTPGAAEATDVAYDAMIEGRHEVAIARLEDAATDDPARLINLAAAYAAQGRYAEARDAYERAAYADRFELETADGSWIDSRVLARRSLAALDQAVLTNTRMAQVD